MSAGDFDARAVNAAAAVIRANTGVDVRPVANELRGALSRDEREFLERRLTEIRYPAAVAKRESARLAAIAKEIATEPDWFISDCLCQDDDQFEALKNALVAHFKGDARVTAEVIGRIVIGAFAGRGAA
ncbi:MAG: hypothetical protein ING75_16970 [Rhodocyclaceae bacterium]|nr:hypothetical protein [Rhodocyclaceae bacterium]